MKSDQCSYPHCRHEYQLRLVYAGVQLCSKHWSQYCAIEAPDEITVTTVVRYEKQKLKFFAKCGAKKAKRLLEKINASPGAYVLEYVGIKGMTILEYIESQRAKPVEPEPEEDESDEFGSIAEYLGSNNEE